MRIICRTADDFNTHLKINKDLILSKQVFIEAHARSLNKDNSSQEITFQATSVILQETGPVLLCLAFVAGIDRHTADGDLEGSRVSSECLTKIKEVCDDLKLQIVPGVCEF